MKKTFSILSMILLGCALYAGPVTPEKALQVAQSVFASAPGTKAAGESELKIVWDGEFEPATKAAQDPAFYVVSRPEGGFVMVAGNDNVQPVLAFSFENDFVVEGMPENVRWWMQQYKDHVRSSVSATPAVREQWEKYESTKADPVISGLTDEYTASRTNEWNQTNPANYYCPDVEGQTQTSVCGCVALATAEIMAWFGTNNPALSSYTIPGYNYTSKNSKSVNVELPDGHALTTSHNWADLKALESITDFYNQVVGFDTVNSNEELWGKLYYGASKENPVTHKKNELTDLGKDLAHLTYDIGTLLQAEYNENAYNGTGAVTAEVITAVAPVFHYNNGARFVTKDSYTSGQWEQLMKEQITQHPIIYTGPGHAYAADGYGIYDSKQYFHFNMGWGGQANGYYTLDIQDKYAGGHYAIIDFYPSASFTVLPHIDFDTNGGITYVSGYDTNTLTFDLTEFYNYGAATFSGGIYAGRENFAGVLAETKPLLSDLNLGYLYGYDSYPNLSVTFSDAVFGDRLVAYYKESDKSTYLPFRYEPLSVGITALPFFPAAAIKRNTSYSVGDYFVFELTNNDYTYQNSIWKVTTPDGTTTQYDMDDYRVQLTAAGDYKISCTTPGQETVVTYITVAVQ